MKKNKFFTIKNKKSTVDFFLVLIFIISSLDAYSQLDSEHYLPPLKQVSNNAAIQQQAIYFSTPETTAFPIEIYRGTSATPLLTLTGLIQIQIVQINSTIMFVV